MTDRISGLRRFVGVREVLIVALIAALIVVLWRADAVAQERDQLDRQLLAERQARAATELSLNALRYRIASGELNDDVQETIIDEKIATGYRANGDELEPVDLHRTRLAMYDLAAARQAVERLSILL